MKKIIQIILISANILISQTSEQIKQAKDLIRKTGMSESQVRKEAKARGYTDKQIDNAIKKGKDFQAESSKSYSGASENIGLPILGKSNEVSIKPDFTATIESDYSGKEFEDVDESKLEFHSEAQPDQYGVSYFGYDIFAKDPALFQSTSVGVVDPDYLIGPGDEIIVMLWGETQFRQVLAVDREGFVFIPEIGQVFVNGLDLDLLESKLFRVFSQSYASLNPQGRTPTTFLDVSLGLLRPLRIQVLGEVAQPGAYTVSPTATLFSSLYYFNGPTNLGSLRDIRLIRGGKEIASIDFYDYLLTGKKLKDQKLQLDDVVFIPRRLKSVSIVGEINRPGIYELKPGEGLKDLVAMAGDLKITAYLKRSQIDRIVPFEERDKLGADRMFADVNLGNILNLEEKFPLQDGDYIHVFSVLDIRQNVVELRGAVTRPGRFDIGDSLKISELINNADGLLGDAYLERAEVFRQKPDFTKELILLNLSKALEGDPENDITLQGLDSVRIYGVHEMVSKNSVSIFGHVKNEGSYFLHENMKLYDLIFKAGGFEDKEFKKRAFLERADLFRMNDDGITQNIESFHLGNLLNSPQSKENSNLRPGDRIIIYNNDIFISNEPVSIAGVVREPGTFNLKTNMTLKDLILEAGGLNSKVYRHRVEVARLDPLNNDLDQYAKSITFDIDDKFSISNVITKESLLKDMPFSTHDFYLKPYDLVNIRPDPFFTDQKQVSISGQVLYPGIYTILNSNEKITDIIQRAGGLLTNAYPEASKYVRNGAEVSISLNKILKNPNSNLNINVLDGDEINISARPNVISITGEINKAKSGAALLRYVPGKRLNYYIKLGGGLTPYADRNNIWVEYPNGESKKYGRFSIISPIILDGSNIVVAKREEQEPFDHTEFAKEVTSIIANLAQAITMVMLAR